MKQIDLMKQTERKKKVLAALCAVLCTGLLSGCSSGGVLDSKEKNEQLKDTILETYDALIGGAGTAVLTPERSLEGRLTRGEDDYTGSYRASYTEFTGTEVLFGGTTLEREEGGSLELTCSLSLESGKAQIFLCSGSDDPEILLSGSGEYTGAWEVDGESTYIGVRCEDAVGELFIQIE